MSRQNKVNPGMYTQRGRLTPDDAARELRKQGAIRSAHTWQPVNTQTPWREPPHDAARDGKKLRDHDAATPPPAELPAASRAKRKMTTGKRASKVKPKTAKKAAMTRQSKKKATTGGAKTGKAARSGNVRMRTKATRNAERTRNVG
jgi:hypothetical protein